MGAPRNPEALLCPDSECVSEPHGISCYRNYQVPPVQGTVCITVTVTRSVDVVQMRMHTPKLKPFSGRLCASYKEFG